MELEKNPLWSPGFQIRDCWDAPQAAALAVELEVRLCRESPGIGRVEWISLCFLYFPVFPLFSLCFPCFPDADVHFQEMDHGCNKLSSRVDREEFPHWDFPAGGSGITLKLPPCASP